MLGRKSVFNFTTAMTGKEGIRAVIPNRTTSLLLLLLLFSQLVSFGWYSAYLLYIQHIIYMAGTLHPYFIYSILFIWMHTLWMHIYMTLQLKILTLNKLWLSIFVTFSLEITLWPLNMICTITQMLSFLNCVHSCDLILSFILTLDIFVILSEAVRIGFLPLFR